MATVHKMKADFYEATFPLIALRSNLEDHAMAFYINQYLKARFIRPRADWELSKDIRFPYFEWKDEVNDGYWILWSNDSFGLAEVGGATDLFQDQPSYTKYHLVPEHKEVDYFLKLEDDHIDEHKVLRTLMDIPGVQTAYLINTEKLKSINNLIH
ncbi:MAG: IPExxxVDY family protein [Flavobacteriaceae bacterium]